MGTTFAILCNDRKTPDEREGLYKSASCLEISFLRGLIFCKGYYLYLYYLLIGIYYLFIGILFAYFISQTNLLVIRISD